MAAAAGSGAGSAGGGGGSGMAVDAAKQDVDLQKFLSTGEKNPRGIPTVVFIDDVEQFLARMGGVAVETAIGAFNELYSKYKFMEQSLGRTKLNMKAKIPDIEKTLELARVLQEKQEAGEALSTHYSLADTIYAKAEVECTGTVCLWLGANVMLEYTYEEAIEVLETSLANAKERLRATNEDLEFLRNQSITVEVNMARLFNWNVKIQNAKKAAAAGGAGAGKPRPTFTEKTI